MLQFQKKKKKKKKKNKNNKKNKKKKKKRKKRKRRGKRRAKKLSIRQSLSIFFFATRSSVQTLKACRVPLPEPFETVFSTLTLFYEL